MAQNLGHLVLIEELSVNFSVVRDNNDNELEGIYIAHEDVIAVIVHILFVFDQIIAPIVLIWLIVISRYSVQH